MGRTGTRSCGRNDQEDQTQATNEAASNKEQPQQDTTNTQNDDLSLEDDLDLDTEVDLDLDLELSSVKLVLMNPFKA